MPDTHEQYASMLRYFWEEKGNIERWTGYDAERTLREFPAVAEAWRQYKAAKALMNAVVKGLP